MTSQERKSIVGALYALQSSIDDLLDMIEAAPAKRKVTKTPKKKSGKKA
jgi:hypothetical protein